MADENAIAVVGLACRFPGAPDEDTYWRNVLNDVYSIAPMPPSRFDRERYFHPEIGAYAKSYCDLGGLVEDHPFDSRAFRMPPKLVENTDVAHLWALETARATLENAGYDPFDLAGSNVGVVVGHARGSERSADIVYATAVEGMVAALQDAPSLAGLGLDRLNDIKKQVVDRVHASYPRRDEDSAIGSMTSGLAGLIANSFGFTGRHMVVDAACASSLGALDIAVRGLLQNRMDAALVGGASYSQQLSMIMFAQSRALSPDGSFPFDKRANGFISSDGFGLLLLRRLEDAVRDGNQIRAIIRGLGGSCDGKGKALWAPRKEGQILAMRRAYEMAKIDPGSIDMIEGHATSTTLGDRTELESLHEVYAKARNGKPMPVGSVKGNIGHTRESAGAAGLIKAILALENDTMPPTGNFREPSPEIPWNELAVEVLTAPRPWTKSEGPRRAGVNAFGIGGLNYHVIVEEAPSTKTQVTNPGLTAADREPERCDVAIVGIGGRFPGAQNAPTFFDKITKNEDLMQEVPPDRWDADIYYSPGDRTPYRTYLKRGAFVTGFEADWRRYKVPPKLIDRNDPLQFMLLDSALEAFDDAGIDVEQIDKKRVSVTVGTVFGSDYALGLALAIRSQELTEVVLEVMGRAGDQALYDEVIAALRQPYPSINEDSSGSFSSSTLASRTAKVLDLMGPTYALDAACGSSLASMEAAVELLRSGIVDVAVHGGGDRAMRVQRYEAYCQFYAVSRDGQPRPFDERADGFVPGEGTGVCILKRLEDAIRDGDPIRAIVRGIGSSSDGEKKSLYKPSTNGLTRAMTRALSQTDLDPAKVGFVECHGGATPLGDRTEVEAVRNVYLEGKTRTKPLVIGSVKSNVGHTQGAAAMMGLIKTTLAMENGVLPPTRGFESPHPDHRFADELAVNAEAVPYPAAPDGRRYAAVSSMGLGGVNYHAVLEHPSQPNEEGDRVMSAKNVFSVSASNEAALAARLGDIGPRALFQNKTDGTGPATLSVAALDADDLARVLGVVKKAGLTAAARDFREKQGAFYVNGGLGRAPKTAFLFCGQGSQYAGMMRELTQVRPATADLTTRLDKWLDDHRRARLSAVILDGAPVPFEVFSVQALVLTADLIAYESLRTLGITPSVVTGHSYGDYAALVAAGAWTFEDALDATAVRAAAIDRSVVKGGMASVSGSLEEVEKVISRIDGVEAANVNAPDQVVIAGTLDALMAAEEAFLGAAIETRRLDVPGPFHSTHMAAARDALAEGLAKIPLSKPNISYLSSITQTIESDPDQIRASLVAQLTKPVLFIDQIEALLASGIEAFVECGPRAVLTGLTRRIAGDRTYVTSVDDKNRAGAWSLARVSAMLDALERAAPGGEITAGPALDLLRGTEAERFLSEPGFELFWEKTRPSLVAFLESLWTSEKRYSTLPAPAPASAIESAIEAAPPPPAEEPAPAPTVTPEPVPVAVPVAVPAGDRPSRSELESFLVDAICEQSGYPPDIIELDADLEADLGIDTVKQAQVLGKVRDHYDLRTEEKLSLRDFPTLGHVLEYVDTQLSKRAAEPAPAKREGPAVPMIDLTNKRSERPKPAIAPKTPPASSSSSSGGPSDVMKTSAAEPPVVVLDTEAPMPALTKPAFKEVAKPALPTIEEAAAFQFPKPAHVLPANAPRPVRVLHLEGTSREIGRQHGEAMRDPILEVLAKYRDWLGLDGLNALAVPETTTRLSKLFDEASLDEIRGVAEAVGVPELVLLAYNLDTALFPSIHSGCTQTVRRARDNDGAMIHCVNEDSPLLLHLDGIHPRVVQVRKRSDAPNPGRTTVLFSLAGQIAGPNGVADTGLSVTSTTLLDAPDPTALPTGAPHPMLTKRIVEQAGSIEDAIAIVENAHKAGRWSLIVSDAESDRAAYLEYDGDEIVCREEVDGDRTTANHSIQGPATGGTTPDHSTHRESRACKLVDAARPLTAEKAKQILRDRHDEGRGREVAHATMNTVRRVDNVMSLVIEPGSRRVHVTDRVVPPGAPGEEEIGYVTIEYGGSQRPTAEPIRERVDTLTSAGAGIVDVAEVMRRYVVRVVEDQRPAAVRRFAPKRVLIAGHGPHAEAVVAALRARGAEVHVTRNATEALDRLVSLGADTIDTIGIVSQPEKKAPWEVEPAVWRERRRDTLFAPFALLRTWAPARVSGTVFGVTFLGGALGFDNAAQGTGDGGGLIGLLKATRREMRGIEAQALDVSPSESPSMVAEALLAELDGNDRLEVGLLRGKRMRLTMAEHRATSDEAHVDLPSTWVVTGGARGVTSRIVTRLAELYQPRLVLLGKHRLPDDNTLAAWRALDEAGLEALKNEMLTEMRASGKPFSPVDWKARCEAIDKTLEIDATLRALADRGSKVDYVSVDLADESAVRLALDLARRDGPIQGLLHGAGVEIAKPFDKKSDQIFNATVGGKVDGLVHLLSATASDPLTHIVGFSSVSGRFGGHGQTDYSLANDAQARILSAYHARHPNVRVSAIAWAAFSEVGLAARSSARTFLEQSGQAFMTPAEGANHLVRELWAGLPEDEVTICERLEALDLDHLIIPEENRAEWHALAQRASQSPMIDSLVMRTPQRTVVERRLQATEPFLDQHRMGPTPILPAVVSLELMSEVAALDGGTWSLADVQIVSPLKVEENGDAVIRAERSGENLRVVSTVRKQDGVVLEPDRVFVRGRRVDAERPVPPPNVETGGELIVYPYPKSIDRTPGSRMIFHGPVFRCLEGVRARGSDGGVAHLVVPAPTSLVPGSRARGWKIPAALLDGCLQAVGMLGRIHYAVVALPAGFGRLDVSSRALAATGERVTLDVRFVERTDEVLVADFNVMAADGPILSVRGYRAQVVPTT